MTAFKIILVSVVLICALSGCNIANTANTAYDLGEYHEGVPLSDFGGNVVLAATAGQQAPEVLASFSTEFDPSIAARLTNIEIASRAIDQSVIQPGEVFSFNEAVGPTEKETGFKLARIFVKGKDSEGYGGGVCQVSSTLYNAANKAGLNILERHLHSKAVSYVPEGEDAATSYGYKDFKFSNDKEFPVMISSSVSDGKLTVEIKALSGD